MLLRRVVGLYSDIQQFTYSPSIVNQTAPANGATVDIPTLRWDDYAQAVKYNVVVKKASGSNAATTTTFAEQLDTHRHGATQPSGRAVPLDGASSPQ